VDYKISPRTLKMKNKEEVLKRIDLLIKKIRDAGNLRELVDETIEELKQIGEDIDELL